MDHRLSVLIHRDASSKAIAQQNPDERGVRQLRHAVTVPGGRLPWCGERL